MIRRLCMTVMICMGAALLLKCSNDADPVAGGTGAGNPSSTTTLAIIADTGFVSSGYTLAKSGMRLSRLLPITDDDSLQYVLDTTLIKVNTIIFILESPSHCSDLLASFHGPFNLECDKEGIALSGTFIFDAVNGTVSPSLDSLRIPAGRYKGIKLMIDKAPSKSSHIDTCATVDFRGNFFYQHQQRRFRVGLNMNAPIKYLTYDSTIIVGQDDTTHFLIEMDASHWFSGVSLKPCLENGDIPLDADGNVTISCKFPQGACRSFASVIKANLVKPQASQLTVHNEAKNMHIKVKISTTSALF
ncbi:MAG: hypothetical protein GF398_15195 [Chitinivibrionales bacterium]|nr:hypothetical protein [Chitinivibrionales bacterium]